MMRRDYSVIEDRGELIEEIYRKEDEIERLTAQLKTAVWSDSEECKLLEAEIERLRAYAQHERSLGAEGPMIELTNARQEVEQLKAELEAERSSQISAVNGMLRAEREVDRLRATLQVSRENMVALSERMRAAIQQIEDQIASWGTKS